MSTEKKLNVPSQSEDIVPVEELKKVLGTDDGLNGGSGSDDGSGSGSGSGSDDTPVLPSVVYAIESFTGNISADGITWSAEGTISVVARLSKQYTLQQSSAFVSVNFHAGTGTEYCQIDGKEKIIQRRGVSFSMERTIFDSPYTEPDVNYTIIRSYFDDYGTEIFLTPTEGSFNIKLSFSLSIEAILKELIISNIEISFLQE